MATFVLVHGSWHGGWCWERLTPLLEAAGHAFYTPTLKGLAERADEATPDVGLMDHVDEVAALMESEDLREVVLVGHSYAGMVITGVADAVAERIATLVYLDACVPEDGQGVMDILPGTRGFINMANVAGNGWLVPPLGARAMGVLDSKDSAWVDSMLTGMPLRTHSERLRAPRNLAKTLPRVYIACPSFGAFDAYAAQAQREGWRYYEMAPDVGHDAMITHPEALAAILLEVPLECIRWSADVRSSFDMLRTNGLESADGYSASSTSG